MHVTTTDLTLINYLKSQIKPANPKPIEELINTVHNMDAVEFLRMIPPEVDLVFTDEPYGVSPTSINFSNRKPMTNTDFDWDTLDVPPEIIEPLLVAGKNLTEPPKLPAHLQYPWVFESARILKPHGMLFNFGVSEYIGSFRDVCRHAGLIWRASGPWIKTNPGTHLRQNNFKSATEFFFFASKGKTKKIMNFQEQQEMHNNILETHCPNCGESHPVHLSNSYMFPRWYESVEWGTPYEIHQTTSKKFTEDRTEKPMWLLIKMLTILGNKDSIVVDPFVGSGSTAVAAKKLGMKYIVNDLDTEMSELTQRRLDGIITSFL